MCSSCKGNPNIKPFCSDDCRHKVIQPRKSRTIPAHVKIEVWRRDNGKCVECGSQERLEYDHIIPFSKGGSNTARNIQILCEKCNRKKLHNKGSELRNEKRRT